VPALPGPDPRDPAAAPQAGPPLDPPASRSPLGHAGRGCLRGRGAAGLVLAEGRGPARRVLAGPVPAMVGALRTWRDVALPTTIVAACPAAFTCKRLRPWTKALPSRGRPPLLAVGAQARANGEDRLDEPHDRLLELAETVGAVLALIDSGRLPLPGTSACRAAPSPPTRSWTGSWPWPWPHRPHPEGDGQRLTTDRGDHPARHRWCGRPSLIASIGAWGRPTGGSTSILRTRSRSHSPTDLATAGQMALNTKYGAV
jgi:hypothetical protein